MWDSSVMATEGSGTEVGLGSRTRGTSKIMGRHFDWTTEIVEFDRPSAIVYKSVEGNMEFSVSNALVPEDGGTRLTYRIDAASGLGGVFGKFADAFVARAQARTVKANLDTLGDILAEHH